MFRNTIDSFDLKALCFSIASISVGFLLLVLAPATVVLPGEYRYLGPVNWDSRVAQFESKIYVTGERQIENDVSIQGTIATQGRLLKPTVIANFASRESGLQLMASPSSNKSGIELYLIVRDDLPIDIDGTCPECGKPTYMVFIGDLSEQSRNHDFLIRIRNLPPLSHVEFDGKVVLFPAEVSPENVDLSVSQISVGNREIVDRAETVSISDFRIAFSSDRKEIATKHFALLLLAFGLLIAIVSWSKPKRI